MSELETPRLTEERLAEIKARADAATPGPWSPIIGMTAGDPREHPVICKVAVEFQVWSRPDATRPMDAQHKNTRFIANARTDVPALIAEIEQLRAEVDTLRNALKTYERVQLAGKRDQG